MLSVRMCLAALVAALAWLAWGTPVPAEDAAPKPEPGKGDGKEARKDRPGGRDLGRGPGMGGPPWMRMSGDPSRVRNDMARMMGLETSAQVEQVPLGKDRRLVTSVPVGGIDGLEGRRGIKAEEVFKLTEEQQKGMEKVREEYKAEMEKLQKEFDEAQKALGAKVVELRKKFELKANEVLTGDAKAAKEKLDALAQEFAEKEAEQEKERKTKAETVLADLEKSLKGARDQGFQAMRDFWEQNRERLAGLRGRTGEVAKEVQEKMKAALTGEAKANLEAALRKLQERPFGRFGGPDRKTGGANEKAPGPPPPDF